MAPKTRGASGSRAGTKRKKPVSRPTREPTPEPSSSSSTEGSPAPIDPTHQVDHLASRVIAVGRKFDFDLFEREGLLVGSQLKEMGFEKICSLDCPVYPALVKEFYRNLTRGDNGLVSIVRGVGLNITAIILSKLLDLPTSGPSTYNPEDRSPALSRLLHRDFEGFEEVIANQLPLDLRLLHNICSRILFPKTGRFDYVSERDIFVMDAVVSGRPINLPTMILWYIADCGSKKKSCLPYGMILTQIFRSQGIEFSDSEPRRNLRHTDYYSLATIHRMGFKKINGNWIRKSQEEEIRAEIRTEDIRAEVEVGPSTAGPSTHSPPPQTSGTTVSFSDEQLIQLRSMFEEFENKRKQEVDQLREEFRELKDSIISRIDLFSFSMGTHVESLNSELRKIFDRLQGIAEGSSIYLNRTNQLRKDIDTAVDQIQATMNSFNKSQKDDILEMIGHLKSIVFKHVK